MPQRDDHAHIIDTLLPELSRKMHQDRDHYGDNHQELGIAGQFADIWRKIKPLKDAMWHGRRLTRESPREICMDLIGHLLLTVALIDHDTEFSMRDMQEVVLDTDPQFSLILPAGIRLDQDELRRICAYIKLELGRQHLRLANDNNLAPGRPGWFDTGDTPTPRRAPS